MANNMKGQFYVLASFIVAMYLFFLLRMFTSTTTEFIVPDVPEMGYIHEAVQNCIDQGDDVGIIIDAVRFIPEPIGIRCLSIATENGTCTLESDEWECGVNVTAVYRGKLNVEITETIYDRNFDLPVVRTPIHVYSNESGGLVEVSETVPFASGTLKLASGETIRGAWSGNTTSFRINLIGRTPRVVHVYHTHSSPYTVFRDVGVLDDTGYDGAVLFSKLDGISDAQNVSLSDLGDVGIGLGPRMLFLPASYPSVYGDELEDYVDEGGIVVAPYGLCSTSGSCLVGNIQTITGSHSLEGVDDYSTLNPIESNSQYFTNPDISWVVYNSTETNSSRAAIGAVAHGEGYVVFVGNESMLSSWSKIDSFLNKLVDWGANPVSASTYICPTQSP